MIPPKALEKLTKRIAKLRDWRYAVAAEAPLEYAETMDHFRAPPDDLRFAPAPAGLRWGRHWGSAWFRTEVEVPRACKGRRVFYRHESECEKLLFVDGEIHCGMNPYHPEALLLKYARGGERFLLHVEAYAGHPIPGMDPFDGAMYTHQIIGRDPGEAPPLTLRRSELVYERPETAGLCHDAAALLSLVRILDENSRRRALTLDGLNAALDDVPMNWRDEADLEAACRAARKRLAPLLNAKNAGSAPAMGLVGHAHIDIGWLWPVREGIRKGARTFATVLSLMDEFPEFRFHQSQPALFDMVERHYPELAPRIRKRVKEGRWEPNGGMWVEADCNIAGGEALVRQFLEGRRKTAEAFGYTPDTLWLPDVFGYSAALPQILHGCGIQHFVTSKINWNDTNRFPYDTFWWRGIDGTEVFTHFIATRTNGYNADVSPESLDETWRHLQCKETHEGGIVSVGHGDGGGGPTREMCEMARRIADLEGCPKAAWTPVSAYLQRMRAAGEALPRWVGELYLEYHRGTYTSQARTKRWNRKLELLLRETECYCAMALADGHAYPEAELRAHWRTLLTNQFHDILPGTSIRAVYETAEEEYAAMHEALIALRDAALARLAEGFVPDSAGQARIIANSLGWRREAIVYLDAPGFGGAVDAAGAALTCQRIGDRLAVRAPVESFGLAPIALREAAAETQGPFKASARALDTPFYTVGFDKSGRITRLYDKEAEREVVREGGSLNAFYCAEDLPVYWDAWDIDRHYRDVMRPSQQLMSREVVSDGPLLHAIRFKYAIGEASTLTQEVVFHAHSRRIDFVCEADWRERRTLLKAGFDLDVLADRIRCDIQFGHVERNTHSNTSWDAARFEFCAHKWVDLSEGNYGVALLNDCKYGHDMLDDRLSLTLLKSAACPDHEADQGAHRFTYALLPHASPFDAAEIVQEAYELNQPCAAVRPDGAPGTLASLAFCTVSRPNIVVEAIKKAEADNAIVLRCYESARSRCTAEFTFARSLRRAETCNLMEEGGAALKVQDDSVTVAFRPFEIKTIKIYFR